MEYMIPRDYLLVKLCNCGGPETKRNGFAYVKSRVWPSEALDSVFSQCPKWHFWVATRGQIGQDSSVLRQIDTGDCDKEVGARNPLCSWQCCPGREGLSPSCSSLVSTTQSMEQLLFQLLTERAMGAPHTYSQLLLWFLKVSSFSPQELPIKQHSSSMGSYFLSFWQWMFIACPIEVRSGGKHSCTKVCHSPTVLITEQAEPPWLLRSRSSRPSLAGHQHLFQKALWDCDSMCKIWKERYFYTY